MHDFSVIARKQIPELFMKTYSAHQCGLSIVSEGKLGFVFGTFVLCRSSSPVIISRKHNQHKVYV